MNCLHLQGLFGHRELQTPEGFYLMKENAMFESEDLVKECCSPHRSRKMVEVSQRELESVLIVFIVVGGVSQNSGHL